MIQAGQLTVLACIVVPSPSGTEDVVRVYAEADTRENTEALAYTVAQAV